MKMNNQERNELNRFTKYLALKSIQIIVQSRLGRKLSTVCKPHTKGHVWFNLNIEDMAEVMVKAEEAINNRDILSTPTPVCVEISLRTVEGDQMVLETWCVGSSSDQCESSSSTINTYIYNDMAIMLRSLLSISRVLPAYKLSRRQGSDSFVLCYRMYMGEPLTQCLGEDFKYIRIGHIGLPLGTLALSVSYRTKMTISPTQANKNDSMMLKSDHFDTNLTSQIQKQREKEDISLDDEMKVGAFVDQKNKNIETHDLLPSPPISELFKPKVLPEKCPEVISEEEEKNENVTEPPTQILETKMDSLTMMSTNDDFIMVDLKTPFANTNENTELGVFYREWQSAPPLLTFVDVTPPEELDIARQLEDFESDLNEYDSVVETLCSSANSS